MESTKKATLLKKEISSKVSNLFKRITLLELSAEGDEKYGFQLSVGTSGNNFDFLVLKRVNHTVEIKENLKLYSISLNRHSLNIDKRVEEINLFLDTCEKLIKKYSALN